MECVCGGTRGKNAWHGVHVTTRHVGGSLRRCDVLCVGQRPGWTDVSGTLNVGCVWGHVKSKSSTTGVCTSSEPWGSGNGSISLQVYTCGTADPVVFARPQCLLSGCQV